MNTYGHFINGEFVDPAGGQWLASVNPFSGEEWARIARGNAEDVARAVSAAKAAMTTGAWSQFSASKRGACMRRLADLLAERSQMLAETETRDNGKPLAETRGQIGAMAEYWHYFAGLADKIQGDTIPVEKADMVAFTTREPVGVVAALTAWNSPIGFIAAKSAPALAAGCAIVLKPSEFASVSTLEFARLTKEAGVPDGVFNVVTGLGQEAGAALVEHPDVAMVSFTGSDETGARIAATAVSRMKRVALELGGKSPNIVFEDADLDLAAAGVVSGIFGAAGQMCSAGSRLLVQSSIRDRFVEKVTALAREIRLGDPLDPATNVGPIATVPQFRKVLDYIDIAKAEGARCLLGGRQATGERLGTGQFVEPTIFAGVTPAMRIAREEVFGPVLAIMEFEAEEDAVLIANDVAYGLVAGVWTSSMPRALRMTKALKVGTVWVNTYRTYSYMVPFGGTKRSGMGRENGIEAIHEYLETKSVFISIADRPPANLFIMR
ncbi:MAG: aldehyde dehydrogenase [Elioraea sp.]|nr:aldehyde dehydrogenase [Elioraea sp.]